MPPFLISEQQKAIVLNPAQPEMLRNLLPMAKEFTWNGHELYAVPHDLDVVRLLRNVGVTVPSPIQYQYNWPGTQPPFQAQRATADFLTLNPRAFVLNDMGTGKTRSVLYAFDFARAIGRRKRMLVACTMSTMERAWGDEIFTNFPHLTFTVLHGTKERRLKLLKHPFDIYIVNHDGLEIIADEVAKRDDIDVITIDELAVFRNSKTDRYKALEKLCAPAFRWVWGLTGSPIPNEPTDAWAQVRLILPSRVPKYFGRFRDQTMTKYGPYSWRPRPNAIALVQDVMQPAIRFTRDDCIDLPETTYQTRHVDLTPQQQKVYNELRARMKSEADEGTVRAVNEADKLMKLVQVAAGAVYTTDGETVTLENGPRVREILDIIEQSPGKVIVFVPFIAALHNMRDELAKHYPTELVYGGTSKAERDQAFWRFQHLPKSESHVLVANASAMAHGLTLTEASTIVWVAPTTSHETFDQANHRIIRAGQKNRTLIVMLEGTAVERQIYARLQQRQAMQGLLLEAVHAASV